MSSSIEKEREEIRSVLEELSVSDQVALSKPLFNRELKRLEKKLGEQYGPDLGVKEVTRISHFTFKAGEAFSQMLKEGLVREGLPEDFRVMVCGWGEDIISASITRQVENKVLGLSVCLSNGYSYADCSTIEEMVKNPLSDYEPFLAINNPRSLKQPVIREVLSAGFNSYSFKTYRMGSVSFPYTENYFLLSPYTVKNAEFPNVRGSLPLVQSLTEQCEETLKWVVNPKNG